MTWRHFVCVLSSTLPPVHLKSPSNVRVLQWQRNGEWASSLQGHGGTRVFWGHRDLLAETFRSKSGRCFSVTGLGYPRVIQQEGWLLQQLLPLSQGRGNKKMSNQGVRAALFYSGALPRCLKQCFSLSRLLVVGLLRDYRGMRSW